MPGCAIIYLALAEANCRLSVIVGYLAQRRQIHIDHVFIGSSDLDQASPVVAGIETEIMWRIIRSFSKKQPGRTLVRPCPLLKNKG